MTTIRTHKALSYVTPHSKMILSCVQWCGKELILLCDKRRDTKCILVHDPTFQDDFFYCAQWYWKEPILQYDNDIGKNPFFNTTTIGTHNMYTPTSHHIPRRFFPVRNDVGKNSFSHVTNVGIQNEYSYMTSNSKLICSLRKDAGKTPYDKNRGTEEWNVVCHSSVPLFVVLAIRVWAIRRL